jgi:hypothetical protein
VREGKQRQATGLIRGSESLQAAGDGLEKSRTDVAVEGTRKGTSPDHRCGCLERVRTSGAEARRNP